MEDYTPGTHTYLEAEEADKILVRTFEEGKVDIEAAFEVDAYEKG